MVGRRVILSSNGHMRVVLHCKPAVGVIQRLPAHPSPGVTKRRMPPKIHVPAADRPSVSLVGRRCAGHLGGRQTARGSTRDRICSESKQGFQRVAKGQPIAMTRWWTQSEWSQRGSGSSHGPVTHGRTEEFQR